ncbi:hypothetical protein [Myroides odoratimimus]|uniref:hypothetical protein n=1 Tax=Myroides odoratimimus TaxID=76832 RepID=UPI000915F593|nr:hypothetical protein [Myroides odoratimimus]SHM53748.1 hypothetical protein SAMN05444275_11525 [Myroides odoratimimus subsp. xuanwuensis]
MMRNFYIAICLLITYIVLGQTGINTHQINPNAALHIEAPLKDKGIIIPRLTTLERDALKLTDLDNGLGIYNIDENCLNYWNKLENKWSSVCGNLGNSEFKLENCTDIKVYGQYLSGMPLNGNTHYLMVPVVVSKPGVYSITALPEGDNGYYYFTKAEYIGVGKVLVKVPAMGVPNKFQTDKFTVKLNGLDNVNGCTFNVEVENSSVKPNYKMVCGSIITSGIYKMDKALTAEHKLSITLDVKPEAIGASYIIESEEVDGISFYGTGKLTATTQTVELIGRGMPNTTDVKKLRIRSNSIDTSVSICHAEVRVTLPKKKLLIVGDTKLANAYDFANGSAAVNQLITKDTNFGLLTTSTVFFEGWQSIKKVGNNADLATDLLGASPFDIVVVQEEALLSDTQVEQLYTYLTKKGVVLMFTGKLSMVKIFEKLTSSSNLVPSLINKAGSSYKLSTVNNKILNGPFGDIRGKYWGANGPAFRIEELVTSDFLVYSDATDQSVPVVSPSDPENPGGEEPTTDPNETTNQGTPGYTGLHQNGYYFVWAGEGGFNDSSTLTSNLSSPFLLDANKKPIARDNFGHNIKRSVSNSIFTANAIAWAIYQSDVDGINSNKQAK